MEALQENTAVYPIWPSSEEADFIRYWSGELEKMGAGQILHWSLEHYHPRLAMVTSLGLSGSVLVSMLSALDARIPVLHIDSGYVFPETNHFRDALSRRFGIQIVSCSARVSIEEFEARNGGPLHHSHPDRCCRERKFEVLREQTTGFDAIICGVRRDQARNRARTPIIEWDERFGVVRIAPLARWTRQSLWEKIRREDIPYNTLYDQGYNRIDCMPCTYPAFSDESDAFAV